MEGAQDQMQADDRDPAALWSIYGAHAAVMLRCGPAVMVAPAPGHVFVLSGADHVDLNQVSSTLSEDVSEVLATGGFLRTPKREALFWSPHLPPETASPFTIERVATGRTHASVHGYSAAMVEAAYGPRLLAHDDVDAWVVWDGDIPVGGVYVTTVDGPSVCSR
jgi:hypothetical protein